MANKYKAYRVVEKQTINELESTITNLIALHWEPLGGIATKVDSELNGQANTVVYLQAIVLPKGN